MRKILIALLSTLGVFAVLFYAQAQIGGGISTAQFFRLVSGALIPVNSSWTIGSSSNRVAAIYATTIDGTNITIGGAVSGSLTVGGLTTSYGGFTGPIITGTSTVADSTLPRLTFTSATGTNVTTTNLYVLKAVVASSTSVLANNSPCTPAYTFQGDENTGLYNPVLGTLAFVNDCNIMMWLNGTSVVLYKNLTFTSGNLFDVGSYATPVRNTYVSTTAFIADLKVISTGTTSTQQVGQSTGGGSRGCQVFGDSDGSGLTYCTYNNGVQSCGTTACN